AGGFGPVGDAPQAAAGRIGAADAVVVNLEDQGAAVVTLDGDGDGRRAGVLGGGGDGLAGDVPRSDLDVGGESGLGRPEMDRVGGAGGEVFEGGDQAAVVEHGGVEPVGESSQVGDGHPDLPDPGADRVTESGDLAVHLGGLEVEGGGQQPLLGAVVEVAFQAPAFLELGGGDACPRLLHLDELQGDGRPEAGVVEFRKRLPGGDRHEVLVGVWARRDPGHRAVVTADLDAAGGRFDRVAPGRDPLPAILHPVGDL